MEPQTIMMKSILAAAALAGLAATAIATSAEADQPGSRSYVATQAINHSFGSKRAVGYFAAQNGACALTMFLAEAEEGHVAPSAARVKVTVKPGESAELASAEGQSLEVKCGKDAAAVEIRQMAAVTTH
jgi:hypothetical protein